MPTRLFPSGHLWLVILLMPAALLARPEILRLEAGTPLEVNTATLGLPLHGALGLEECPAGLECMPSEDGFTLQSSTSFGWKRLDTTAGSFLLKGGSRQPVEFRLQTLPGLRVTVFGSFNSWNRSQHPLEETRPGVYEATVALDPGRHEYLFKVDTRELLDPANPDSVGNGLGGHNSLVIVEGPKERNPVIRRLGWTAWKEVRQVRFAVENLEAEAEILAVQGRRAIPDESMILQKGTLIVELPLDEAEDLLVAVTQRSGASALQRITFGDDFRWEDAVVYSVMPDRFRDGDPANNDPVEHPEILPPANWNGGDLQGILDALREGYFEDLGVNTLWIFPVVDAAEGAWQEYLEPFRYYTGYHGYWPVANRAIEPRFGDESLLKELVAEAHARDMRVLLDFVSNHIHQDHPWASEHPDWFTALELEDGRRNLRLWDEYRLSTWFEPFLPDLDFANPEVVDAMCDNALWWLKTFDLDGFRHDAVKHVPRPFWVELTRRIRTDPELADRQIYQIGETFGSDELILSYVSPEAMDAQFNFNLYHPARALFLDTDSPFSDLAATLEQNLAVCGRLHLMGNLMDSHDKARYAVFADGDMPLSGVDTEEVGWAHHHVVDHMETYDKIRLYMTYMMTIPGIPFVYYGDEIGMSGAGDPDNRRKMRFGKDVTAAERSLKEDIADLIRLRRERPELRRGDFEIVYRGSHCLAWLRSAENASGRISRSLVALNRSGETRTIRVDLPLGLASHDLKLEAWEGRVLPLPAD